MTLQDAQQLAWSFNRPDSKLFIERASIFLGQCGDYLLVVEPVEGEPQIFTDAEKAQWALVEWMAKSAKTNDRFFTLAENGIPKECDRETWIKDSPNREKTHTKIACSSEIEATISFSGWAPSMIHMDEEVKLWNAGFCITAKNEYFGGTNFKSLEEAKTFVDRYISKGCPPSGFPFVQFLVEYNSGP